MALNEVDWDVHKGIKWLRLQQQLQQRHGLAFPAEACSHALEQSGWNVLHATNFLRATQALDDTTEV